MGRRVGVLAVQGDVEAHAKALQLLGAETVRVRQARDLVGLDALILPGGESTTISKGIERAGLWQELRDFVRSGRPILGTCAGAILLARRVDNHPVGSLGALDVVAVRNAYGTQVDSFSAVADAGAAEGLEGFRCIFIRAPKFAEPAPAVATLLRVEGAPVLVQQGSVMACSFHPELTSDTRIHARLLGA
ncbi:MAG: pyridoxal 5'-phosphate synthase glutaminase subunit PdxT [Myxococcota bacterium]|jgi:5'-phosphate synthase pdxT subunit